VSGYTDPVLSTATLTEKGLLATGDVFVVAAILSVAAGLLVGRWRILVAGPLLAALAVAGIAAGWWGGGLGDHWESSLVRLALVAAALPATGVSVALVVRRFRALDSRWKASVASATLVGIAAYWFVSTRPLDVDDIQARAASTLYYLGDSFEGYRLTDAEEWGGRALFAYGDCEVEFGRGADGGCSAPIQLQEAFNPGNGPSGCGPPPGTPRPKPEDPAALVVFAGSTMIEIYAHDRSRGRRAARALRPISESCP
jgi:hypothetical protein